MAKLDISWKQLANELAEWERLLEAGQKILQKLGNPMPGATARDQICRLGKARLFRYRPVVESVQAVPSLLVYALVNRPSMADLQSDRSMIRGLLERGVDLHLVEWDDPTAADVERGLDDYLNIELAACVQRLAARGPINLLGICQGGTFVLCHAALQPGTVRNLVTMVTPVDFHTPHDLLSHLFRHVDVELLGQRNVSGDLLNSFFLSLKPYRLTQQKYVNLVGQMEDPEALATFLRLEQWIFDSPDLAGRALREFASACYRDNDLMHGRMRVGENRVDLGRIEMPVLNVFARDDHLVPPPASRALEKLVGSRDYQELEIAGGHIGIYVGGTARRRVVDGVAGWLSARV